MNSINKLHKASSLTLMAVAIVSLCSCSIFRKSSPQLTASPIVSQPSTALPSDGSTFTVINDTWTITKAGDRKIEVADEEMAPSMTFNLNDEGVGEIYVFTGCNYLNGEIAFNPARETAFFTGEPLLTMMSCDPEAEKIQSLIVPAINNVAAFRLEREGAAWVLSFLNVDEQTLVEGRRWDNAFLNGAWKVTAINGRDIAEDSDMQLVIDLDGLKVHGSTGCNVFNGSLRVVGDRQDGIEFGTFATTMKACPEPALSLERELLVALESVESCSDENDGNVALLCDSSGKPVIRMQRLKLR